MRVGRLRRLRWGLSLRRPSWDDRIWDRTWERDLDLMDRHNIAWAVWRRQVPDDRYHARIASELARRWRRGARNLAGLYTLWTLFWGSIALFWPPGLPVHPLPGTLAFVGLAAILTCVAIRRRLVPVALYDV